MKLKLTQSKKSPDWTYEDLTKALDDLKRNKYRDHEGLPMLLVKTSNSLCWWCTLDWRRSSWYHYSWTLQIYNSSQEGFETRIGKWQGDFSSNCSTIYSNEANIQFKVSRDWQKIYLTVRWVEDQHLYCQWYHT